MAEGVASPGVMELEHSTENGPGGRPGELVDGDEDDGEGFWLLG